DEGRPPNSPNPPNREDSRGVQPPNRHLISPNKRSRSRRYWRKYCHPARSERSNASHGLISAVITANRVVTSAMVGSHDRERSTRRLRRPWSVTQLDGPASRAKCAFEADVPAEMPTKLVVGERSALRSATLGLPPCL